PPEREDHAALVVGRDGDRGADDEEDDDDHRDDSEQELEPAHRRFLRSCGCYARRVERATWSVSPSIARTSTASPAATGPSGATARHSSPSISTWPSGFSALRTTPTWPPLPPPPAHRR